jgi:hypothetical protein
LLIEAAKHEDCFMGAKYAAAALLLSGAVIFGQSGHAAQRPKHHHTAKAQPQQQIACTVLGCMTIPAACTPVAGKTPGGRPTGYDVIMCPPGVWPLK